MGAPIHGVNSLIYIGGTELVGANAWSIDLSTATAEAPIFDDTWMKKVVGITSWSGSISAWEQTDEKILMTAASAQAVSSLLIYPNRDDLADYYSGDAFFGASSDGSISSAVAKNGTFEGHDTLTVTGFA